MLRPLIKRNAKNQFFNNFLSLPCKPSLQSSVRFHPRMSKLLLTSEDKSLPFLGPPRQEHAFAPSLYAHGPLYSLSARFPFHTGEINEGARVSGAVYISKRARIRGFGICIVAGVCARRIVSKNRLVHFVAKR